MPVIGLLEDEIDVTFTYNDTQPPLHPKQTFKICKKKDNVRCHFVKVLNVSIERVGNSSHFHRSADTCEDMVRKRCGLYLPRFALRTAVRFASAGLGRYQLFYSIINKVRDLVFSYTGPVILVKNHCESLQERSSRRSNLCVEKFDK